LQQFWSGDGSNMGSYSSAHDGCVWSCAWDSAGGFLASSGEDGFVRLWSEATRTSNNVKM
jgi:WD40 repeat protein